MRHPLRLDIAVLAGLFVLAGCKTPVTNAEVDLLMDVQREAWNRGDLAGFVSYYDPSMTFCGGTGVTRGIDNLLTRYQKRYPTAKERGRVGFEIVEVRPLGGDSALVIGKYALVRESPSSGYFTLVVIRSAEGLRIIHDHTSETPPK